MQPAQVGADVVARAGSALVDVGVLPHRVEGVAPQGSPHAVPVGRAVQPALVHVAQVGGAGVVGGGGAAVVVGEYAAEDERQVAQLRLPPHLVSP